MDSSELLPVGRRVAYWRGRRRLSQQVFADRLGRSKSWVDKVERGVRSLDKVSTLRDIAAVLRIDTAVLLGRDARPATAAERVAGVERIRDALSAYEIALGRPAARAVPPADRVVRDVGHAWVQFHHARYPQVVAVLPGLLADVQRVAADDHERSRPLLVEAYRLTASLLVKLGEVDLGWLAADRAMATGAGDPLLVAAATVQLGQVFRASGRARAAVSAALAAAYRIAPPEPDDGGPGELSLCGTLLVQAALAASRRGDDQAVADLLDEAADMAAQVGEGHDHHRTAFGPTAVDLARTAAALDLGHAGEAVAWHERTTRRDAWRWLPLEHRAAHLVDAARAYLQADDPANAGRVLADADRMAPAEVRHRPATREVLAQVARARHAPADIIRLAAALGAT
ncbi:helix-turn-helix domain-containing protein [Micromonospora sp. WMMD987]|uniref:helix-turn-helix domain-containing protein n=1 Tax=Micromonospora sp. WMMD987 TaxID=3016089 RepID=UPI00249B9988|nr:helix-turn-helix domain-containing protein [Micromonospora sp. WMMD987]WFE95794.1 helix-turn-helix domain-containing protein [Micromonospora sp. WMMD987]